MAAARVQPRPNAARYERHRPETTLLYELVERHYPAFVAALGTRGRTLPAYVHDEFAAYLKCGRLEHGFIRVRCTQCHAERLAKHSSFSLHAGVAAAAHQRDKVERLCRYIARPAVATGRLSLTAQGLVRYTLKTPYRDGTTHVIFEPLDFIARLAALVPKPRVHLTRYHGVLAPHSALRAQVTPAGRGKRIGASERSPAERHRAMSWAQCLKRVFRLDIEQCERCGGKVKIIASIDDPQVIGEILAHLEQAGQAARRLTPALRTAPAGRRGRGSSVSTEAVSRAWDPGAAQPPAPKALRTARMSPSVLDFAQRNRRLNRSPAATAGRWLCGGGLHCRQHGF